MIDIIWDLLTTGSETLSSKAGKTFKVLCFVAVFFIVVGSVLSSGLISIDGIAYLGLIVLIIGVVLLLVSLVGWINSVERPKK